MKISILGTNGFLSTAIAKYANEAGWYLDMYGLDEPTAHKFDNFYKVNLMDEPTLKSKACLKCLYFTKIISALCCYLEYFSYLYTIN